MQGEINPLIINKEVLNLIGKTRGQDFFCKEYAFIAAVHEMF
jgi:hypothetical protein